VEDGLVACPFCGEEDFDLPGLKLHLEAGWCDAYERVERRRTMFEEAAERGRQKES